MTVHIEELVSEVTVVDGEFPLTPAQVDRLADVVLARLDRRTKRASPVSEGGRAQ